MDKLSDLDISFLYLENNRAPMHYGGLYVFRKQGARSKLDVSRVKEIINHQIADIPILRQRLVKHSSQNDHPIWADDPDFALDNHVIEMSLPEGTNLQKAASKLFSAPLDQSKPLWSITYIGGLEADKKYTRQHFALLVKTHISTTDAQNGDDLISSLLQISPDPIELNEPEEWAPPPLPAESSWLENAYNSAVNLPSKLTYLAKDTAALAFYSVLFEQLQKLNLPSSIMSVAGTPINRQVTENRTIDTIEIPLDKIRELRRKFQSVTTNDIVMGICAEALNLYLHDQGADATLPLIALTPISVRSKSLNVKSGNQLNVALFSLVTTEPDPIKRIHLIHRSAKNSNHYADAISANRLTELEPTRIAALSARGYCEFLLAQKHKPMFNLPIINIPGPQFPLFLENAELEGLYTCSPLFDGITLAINIISYNGLYHITCTSCAEDNQEPFSSYISRALETISNHRISEEYTEIEQEESQSSTGAALIEDAIGLVSNLFSFSSNSTEKEN